MSRPPVRHDIVIEQGTYWSMELMCYDDAGALVDTAGWNARMHVRATVESGGVVFPELNATNGRITLGIQGTAPDQYNVLITILHGDTDGAVNWGLGVYDVLLIDAYGRQYRPVEGTAVLSPAVTR